MKSWRNIAAVLVLALGPLPEVGAQITTGSNLIVNPGAENGASYGSGLYKVNSWTVITGPKTNQGFCAAPYGRGSGPGNSTPGSPNRGKRYFMGGTDCNSSSAQQTITGSSPALQAAIDAGTVDYNLSGYLGGWQNQSDHADVTLGFLDAGGASLSSVSLKTVDNNDRKDTTKMIFRQKKGTVPAGTRSLQVTLKLTRDVGTNNDGYADDLALVLTQNAVIIVEPAGGVTASEAGATGTYDVFLAAAPSSNVTITLNPDSQVTVSPPTLTFTPANFAAAQTVTVTAVDDTAVESDHIGIITHAATSADASYNGIGITDVSVQITDNEVYIPDPPPTPDEPTDGSGNSNFTEGAYYNTPGPASNGEGACTAEGAFLLMPGKPARLRGPFALDARGELALLPAPPDGHVVVVNSAPPRTGSATASAEDWGAYALALAALLLLLLGGAGALQLGRGARS